MVAKIAVSAANFAIDKPYSYAVPETSPCSPVCGSWYPLAEVTAIRKALCSL